MRDSKDPRQTEDAFDKLIKDHDPQITPELCALRTMGQMLTSYRKDILQMRLEYKELQKQESTQTLVNLHMQHKLESLDNTIRQTLDSYSALRDDYFMQRACFFRHFKENGRETR